MWRESKRISTTRTGNWSGPSLNWARWCSGKWTTRSHTWSRAWSSPGGFTTTATTLSRQSGGSMATIILHRSKLIIQSSKLNFQFIRKTGSVSREIRDIQNQIRQEESRDLQSKVEKLTRDLQTLHRENAEMATFIKSKQWMMIYFLFVWLSTWKLCNE